VSAVDAEPGVAVVAVTYSPGETLEPFLRSLAGATTRPYAVVLADNGSADGAPERAERLRPEVRLLRTGGNLGYGRAANAGVAATDTEFVVVANPDLVWSPGALDELLAAARRWPAAAALGPLIRTPEGDVYPSARDLPSLFVGVGHALCGWWWPTNPWTRSYRRQRGPRAEGPAGWLSGSCLLLRRAAFESVSGFSPDYFMYFEDTDLGDRLGQAGWLNVYVPAAEVTHVGGHSTRHRPAAMLAAHHRSAATYLAGRYSGWGWWPVRIALRAGLGMRSLVAQRVSARTERKAALQSPGGGQPGGGPDRPGSQGDGP
jgi:N-acetylglucosaminyl-diphospho-decaprenol L-rhamnosyltransferase